MFKTASSVVVAQLILATAIICCCDGQAQVGLKTLIYNSGSDGNKLEEEEGRLPPPRVFSLGK